MLATAAHADLVSWWQAAVLGLVEGITEYLPVSSTGHLIIASALMGLDEPPAQKAAVDAAYPDIIVNASAYTAVDKAESEPERADRINHLAVGQIGELAGIVRAIVQLLVPLGVTDVAPAPVDHRVIVRPPRGDHRPVPARPGIPQQRNQAAAVHSGTRRQPA